MTTYRWLVLAALALLAAVPRATSGYGLHVLTVLLMFAAMAVAWSWLGLDWPDLGAASFFGLGSYGAVMLVASSHAPLAAGLLAAVFVSAAWALLAGSALLRLGPQAFALATLAVSQGLLEVARRWPAAGGDAGLSLPAVGLSATAVYWCFLALAAVALLLPARSSGWGRLRRYVLAGLVIGLAGALHAVSTGFVDPGSSFDAGLSLEVAIMALLGGTQKAPGPLVGAAILTAAGELLNAYAPGLHLVVLALLLALVVIFLPNGLMGLLAQLRQSSRLSSSDGRQMFVSQRR